jgi:hypothetical protein
LITTIFPMGVNILFDHTDRRFFICCNFSVKFRSTILFKSIEK